MRARLIVLFCFIVLDTLVFIGKYQERHRSVAPMTMSEAAPDFTWTAFDGGTHALRDLKRKVVVIHFWAAWCAPCREELPRMFAAAKELGNDVVFLTISSDGSADQAQAFLNDVATLTKEKPPANVLFAIDSDRKITYELFQTVLYPESIMLDSNLQMRRKVAGPVEWESREIQNYLHQLKKP